jgi:hypothetical protein
MKRPAVRRAIAAGMAAIVATAMGTGADGYLKLGYDLNGEVVSLQWARFPVPYWLYSASVPGVSAADFQVAVGRAFDTWEHVPTAEITYRYDGFTLNPPGLDDGLTTLGFLPRPELDRVLASTSFLVDDATGELVESDIFFNSIFPWSVASGGENGRYDLQSIALHEIGHLSGLGHSLLGETDPANGGRRVIAAAAVMFPIAFAAGSVVSRELKADDIAGISDLYPTESFRRRTGSISGRVTRNGQGVFGAHIAALHLATGELVGNFSLTTDGQFSIAGVQPGAHVLRVEPLDDAEVESFFDSDQVGVDFRAAFHPRVVVVPRGADSGAVEIQVVPR